MNTTDDIQLKCYLFLSQIECQTLFESVLSVTYDHLIPVFNYRNLLLHLLIFCLFFSLGPKEWQNIEKEVTNEENINVNCGDSDVTNDSEELEAVSDDINVSNEKEENSSEDDQSSDTKVNETTEKIVDSNVKKGKSAPKSSIDILSKVFPNMKTQVLFNALKECEGDVLQTIERLVNSGAQTNGKRKICNDSQNDGIDEHKSSANNNSQISLMAYKQTQSLSKDMSKSSPKCSPHFNPQTINTSLNPNSQPFLSMLTNISNSTVGIPPPLVSSMSTNAITTSPRSSIGSSRPTGTGLSGQFSHSSNLNPSIPRGLFGSVGSPYTGLFPVFPSAATNFNLGIFGGSGGSAHNSCSPNTFPIVSEGMALDHLHHSLKRNSNTIISENDWYSESKRSAHEKKATTELIADN